MSKGALRCSICAVNLPNLSEFKECPKCHEPTSYGSNLRPMKKAEAHTFASNAKFEEFYRVWDASHDAERLSPDFDPTIAERFSLSRWSASISEPEKA